MQPDIYAMILNWNGAEDTIRCLGSLGRLEGAEVKPVVVDNGSTDGGGEKIARAFPGVELISTGRNLGYTGGNNFGLRLLLERKPDFIWLLNNDTVVGPGCLAALLSCSARNPRAGIFAPQVRFLGRPGTVWSQGIDVEPFTGRIVCRNHGRPAEKGPPRTVRAVSGAVMLVRRETLEEAGLFDDRFAFYHEDVELCLRAAGAGWKTMVVPEAKAWHRVGSAMSEAGGSDGIYYLARNHLLVMNNSFPLPLPARGLRNSLISLYNLLFLLFTTRKGDPAALKALGEGVSDYFKGRWGMRTGSADGGGNAPAGLLQSLKEPFNQGVDKR